MLDVNMISIFKLGTFLNAKLLNKEDLSGSQTTQLTVLISDFGSKIPRKVIPVAVMVFTWRRVMFAIDIKL